MADIIYSKQDVPSSLKDEATKYAELAISELTISGSGSFISNSSGSPVTYNYSAGTQDLFNQLDVILEDYRISAINWNAIRSWLYGDGMPVIDGYRETLNRNLSGKLSSAILYTSSAELVKVAEQILTYDSGGKVLSAQKYIYDLDGATVLVNYTDTISRDSSGKVAYKDRSVVVF